MNWYKSGSQKKDWRREKEKTAQVWCQWTRMNERFIHIFSCFYFKYVHSPMHNTNRWANLICHLVFIIFFFFMIFCYRRCDVSQRRYMIINFNLLDNIWWFVIADDTYFNSNQIQNYANIWSVHSLCNQEESNICQRLHTFASVQSLIC